MEKFGRIDIGKQRRDAALRIGQFGRYRHMFATICLITSVCIFAFQPAFAFNPNKDDVYKLALERVITEVVQNNWARLKLVSILKSCGEKEALARLYEENVIGEDIKNVVSSDPVLSQNQEKWTYIGTAFISGFEMGWGNGQGVFLQDENEKEEVCKFTVEQANKL